MPQTEPYVASYGPKPFWGWGPKFWGATPSLGRPLRPRGQPLCPRGNPKAPGATLCPGATRCPCGARLGVHLGPSGSLFLHHVGVPGAPPGPLGSNSAWKAHLGSFPPSILWSLWPALGLQILSILEAPLLVQLRNLGTKLEPKCLGPK